MPQKSKINLKKTINQELLALQSNSDVEYAKIEENLSSISSYFKTSKIYKELNKSKSKGYKAKDLFYGIIFSIFYGVDSILALSQKKYFLTESEKEKKQNAAKDAYYRFLNNEKNNWRKMQHLYVEKFNSVVCENSVENENPKLPHCMIIDDSVLPKSGKTFEHISRVHDHTTNSHILGYKYLALGLYDGKSFIPVDFSLHGEAGKKGNYGLSKKELENRSSKNRDKKSHGTKRENEYFIDKITNAISMLRTAKKKGITAKYLLVDSWFFSEKMIKESSDLELKIIGQWKKNNQNIILDGKESNLKTLALKCERKAKKSKYSKKFKSKYFEFIVDYKGTKLKIFVTKFKKNKNWRIVATSDLSLNFNTAIKYYSIRWSIEVYFKEAKQIMDLGKKQSECFDAQIGMITIANLQYIMLALHKRFNSYETIGGIFRELKNYVLEMTIAERIIELLFDVLNFIFELLNINNDEIEFLIRNILQDDNNGKRIIYLLEYDKKIKNISQAG